MSELPRSIQENPRLENWLDFSRPGVVRVFSAKVELGQGITTAIAQIAAQELGLALGQIEVIAGDTRCCPNESYTAGSMSIEVGGSAVKIACREARQAILDHAAESVAAVTTRLSLAQGHILLDGNPTGLDYWQIAPRVDWRQPITGSAVGFEPPGSGLVGRNVPRLDLPAKVAGGAFIHDLEFPNLVHGRVLRAPSAGARLTALDSAPAARVAGVTKLFRSGDFAAVCCETEYAAVKALEVLRVGAQWRTDPRLDAAPWPQWSTTQDWAQRLLAMPTLDAETVTGAPPAPEQIARRLSATYSRPPVAHASIAPSCALAQYQGEQLTVWSHTQGVFPLRAALALALNLPAARITVIHVQGAGCYGHNGADDVAMDAALLALQVAPRPVRVQWSREDELACAPMGSPMVIKLTATLGAADRIVQWSSEIWSGPHAQRAGFLDGVNLLAATQMGDPIPFQDPHQVTGAFVGADRNSTPPYELPFRHLMLHRLADLPLRLSSLRTLGGYANVFASESFMDELAELTGADPVEFRLRHLSDPRARRVVELAASMAHWQAGARRGTGTGAGIGLARYKNTAAYVAVVAAVEAAEQVHVTRVWCAVDAGAVINPDGVINQIEGGIIQAISWTLKEQVTFDGGSVSSRSWEQYPILRFNEIPQLQVELIANPTTPSLGAGEAALGPAAAAIANAVAQALDLRVRDLPLSREHIIAAASR